MTTPLSGLVVEVAIGGDGTTGYVVALPPEELPPVRARDLLAAWQASREAAGQARWGVKRLFRFRREGGAEPTELALADPDACCWAGAVDGTLGLASAYGISVCLRLLALVDLLATTQPHAAWPPLVTLRRDAALLDPGLVREAAALPLTAHGRLDESLLRARLQERAKTPPSPPIGAVA